MNIFLVLIAALFLSILCLPAFIFELSTFSYKKLNNYFLDIAIAVDQLGNVFCRHLLNKALAKNSKHLFGNPDETVSGVLGKNKKAGTLTKLGLWIADNLNMLEKNHVEKAIEKDE